MLEKILLVLRTMLTRVMVFPLKLHLVVWLPAKEANRNIEVTSKPLIMPPLEDVLGIWPEYQPLKDFKPSKSHTSLQAHPAAGFQKTCRTTYVNGKHVQIQPQSPGRLARL